MMLLKSKPNIKNLVYIKIWKDIFISNSDYNIYEICKHLLQTKLQQFLQNAHM